MGTRSPAAMMCSVAACLAACTTGMQDPSSVEQQQGACSELEDRRFESVADLECGLTPGGVNHCKWSVVFTARDDASSSFQWRYADVGEAGHVECNGGSIISATTRSISGAFDVATNRLLWHGETYTLSQ